MQYVNCNTVTWPRWKYKGPPVTFDMQYALRVVPLLSYMEVYGAVDWVIVDESLGFELSWFQGTTSFGELVEVENIRPAQDDRCPTLESGEYIAICILLPNLCNCIPGENLSRRIKKKLEDKLSTNLNIEPPRHFQAFESSGFLKTKLSARIMCFF